MKKVFGIILGLLLGTSCCFAESFLHVRSGDAEINYKIFLSAEVRNYSGEIITANGQTILSGSKQKIYDSHIFLLCDSGRELNVHMVCCRKLCDL